MSPVTFEKSAALPAASPAPPTPKPAAAAPPTSSAAQEIANLEAALEHLKTSSNATLGGTIVHQAIQMFETAIANLKVAIKK